MAYTTYIDEYFANGQKVLVAVWKEAQLVPAQIYIRAAVRRRPSGDAVAEVNTDRSLRTGQMLGDRRVIRFHFCSSSGGGDGPPKPKVKA